MRSIKLTFLLGIFCLGLNAQDIHFSQFYNSPIALNPALTGCIDCDDPSAFRAGANFRDQWRFANAYTTFSGFFDMRVNPAFLDGTGNKLGVGLFLYNDQAGDASLSTFQLSLSSAYQMTMGRKEDQQLKIGLNLGFLQKSIDQTALEFADQWDGTDFQGSTNDALGTYNGRFDAGLGVYYKSYANPDFIFGAGMYLNHLTAPKESFLDDPDNKLGSRFLIHGDADWVLDNNRTWKLRPELLMMFQTKAAEITPGADIWYHLQPQNPGATPVDLFVGAHYRVTGGDAFIPRIGGQYNNFKLTASYDLNTSSLTEASGGQGGFEISLLYFNCPKPPRIINIDIPCPRISDDRIWR